MATDNERLLLTLEAQTRNFERALEQSERQAERRFAAIEKRANTMVRKINQDFSSFADQSRNALAALGLGLVVRDVTQLADVWTTVGNRLSFAGVSAERLAASQQAIADIASRTRSDLDATADLFARMFRASEDLGASQERVLRVTEIVSKALAGASQSERQGAIRQLGQGLASGRLQGDELRSILENSRPIAEAIAREFDTTVGNLRKLGAAGVLESRRVFEAIERAGADIDEAFSRTNFTVADSFTRLRTEAARFIGTNDQTQASVRGLTGLIDGVANNFDLLADAVVIAATVIGGSFAGTAIARALVALQGMILAMTTASTRAAALSKALTFFGGPLGIALTVAGGAMAYLATQTDVFASKAELIGRAEDSLYRALQVISGLEVATEGAAQGTGAVADEANRASSELDAMTNSATDASGAAADLEQSARDLADIQREQTLATIDQAIADREAMIAAERRTRALRDLNALINPEYNSQREGLGLPTQEEANRATEAAIASSEQRIQMLERIRGRIERNELRPASTPTPEGADPNGNGAAGRANRRSIEDLEIQAALTLARLQHQEDIVREIEDATEAEKRTKEYVEAGLALADARVKAEGEVRAQREAMNAEAQRSLELSRLQDSADLARLTNNIGLADAMSDQLEIARRTRELVDEMALSEAEAAQQARDYVEARRAAINQERESNLATRTLETEAEAARLRGDSRAENALNRRLELEQRISELRRMGLSEEAAQDRAQAELDTLEQADLRGKFRDWFSGGVRAALDGDGDYFEEWIRDRFSRGLDAALDEAADLLFDSFSGLLSSVMRSGEDGIGSAIAAVFAGGATGGLDKLGAESAKAAEALGGALTAAAADAASKVILTGTAAATSAAQESAAASAKSATTATLITAENLAAKAALNLARALSAAATASRGGDAGSSIFGNLLGGVLRSFSSSTPPFGGFRAGGGPMAAGVAYMTGERGRELIVPQVPSFAIPNGALGGGNVTLVDNTTISIQGASTAEVSQLKSAMRQMLITRNAAAVQAVREAARRPRGMG